MNPFRRLASSAFLKAVSHVRSPTRPIVFSKIVPVATGAAVFGMGCMMGSPAFGHKILPGGKRATLVPLSLDASTHNKDTRTDEARIIDHETNPEPATYGAQLLQRIDQERSEYLHLRAQESNKPSTKGQLELESRFFRLKSLHDARLLEQNSSELNRPYTDTTSTLQKAQEAIVSGETKILKDHIKEFIEKNQRLGLRPTRPASELEKFMEQMPAGSAVLARLKLLQSIATKNTEETRLLLEDTMYWLWWVLEKKIRDFARK